MKELRFSVGDGEWRIAYAFDPRRRAMLQVGASKSGVTSHRFYKRLIATADDRLDDHLTASRRQEEIGMPVKFEDMMQELFTPKERAANRRKAAKIAKRHMALRELRQARNRTQISMAKRLGVKQVSISRLESREDPRLSTLTKYIDAMGGQLHLIVEFPEHEPVLLRNVGKSRAKGENQGRVVSLLSRAKGVLTGRT